MTLHARFLQHSILALASCAGLTACFGQATFAFQNWFVDAPVFDADGNRLFGTNYLAAMYGGPSPDSLQPAFFRSDLPAQAPVTFLYAGLAGYFQGDTAYVRNVPSGPGGAEAWLQVRAWDTRLGATYEEVAALGQGGFGESNIFRERGGRWGRSSNFPRVPIWVGVVQSPGDPRAGFRRPSASGTAVCAEAFKPPLRVRCQCIPLAKGKRRNRANG